MRSAALQPECGLAFRVLLGPLATITQRPIASVLIIILAVFLTLATQVGGAVLWLCLPAMTGAAGRARRWGRIAAGSAAVAAFAAIYLPLSLLAMPPLATALGRAPLPCFATADSPYRAASPLYCLANRRYTTRSAGALLQRLSQALNRRFPGTIVAYLDAGFPFLDGFPLFPHLSHNDGRKVDVALFYRDVRTEKAIPAGGAWPLGYWAFALRPAGIPSACVGTPGRLSLRWDMAWLQPVFAGSTLDEARTGAMLRWLAANGRKNGVAKVLIEPHLRSRFGLSEALFRFQGCRAARHDDHIHIEMRR